MKLLTLSAITLCQSAFAATVSTGECSAYTATNTQGAIQNFIDCEMPVIPGDILHISTCNASTLTGDTYLRLFDPTDSVELAEGDDGCGSDSDSDRGGTTITYEVPIAYPNSGVTLHLHQGCFSTFSCGGVVEYTLNVESSPVSQPSAAPADDDPYFEILVCPVEECVDARNPVTGWNECDMCICENFDEIFLSDLDHDCNANEVYYMCMVKYHVQSGDIGGRITCTTRMKPGWVAGFFFIALCGFILVTSVFGKICWILCLARPNKPVQPVLTESRREEPAKALHKAKIYPESDADERRKEEQETERDDADL
jgi:hypothetical protein